MKNRVAILSIAIMFLSQISASAQQRNTSEQTKQAAAKEEPATQFEKFLSRKGSLIIKDFYPVGILQGIYSTRIKIEAAVVATAGDPLKVYAVRFEVPAKREYGSEQTGVMDFDELLSLEKALDYMIEVAPRMKQENRPYTEVVFSTRGGLSAGYYQSEKEQKGFIRVNSYSSDASAYFPVEQLPYLRTLVSQAREKLTSLGAK